MRRWLKYAVALVAGLLGVSALWVWAAAPALTGPQGRNVVFTDTNVIDIDGTIGMNILRLHQQASPPPTPAADDWLIYPLSTGVFIRDDLGNIIGPLGTGGGGGGTGLTATLVTTSNITLSGEQTFETILTSGTRVFVAGQTTATQNGLYITGPSAWARASDALAGAAFTAGTLISISNGLATSVGNKGSTWLLTGSGTYGSTNLTSVKTGLGPAGELIANRSTLATSVASGTIGSTAGGKVPVNRLHEYVAHTDLSATSQIDFATHLKGIIGIQNAGAGNVLLTTGNPRITGCTAGNDGVHLELVGLSTTKTVTIPDGQGVLLAGALGSGAGALGGVTVGIPPGGNSALFRCNGGTTTWEQSGYATLQQAKNAGRDMFGAVDAGTSVRIGTDVNTHMRIYANTIEAIVGGVLSAGTIVNNLIFGTSGSKPTCSVTERMKVWSTLGGGGVADSVEVCAKNSSDVYAWTGLGAAGGRGTVTTTLPLRLDTVDFANENAFIIPQDRTNYDTNVVAFTDNVTGCAFYKTFIPANLATNPLWNVQIGHSALSGGGGNVVLTLAARLYDTNVAKDSALTALTLPSSGVVGVSTSANTTRTTLGATNFDSTVALAASQLLRVQLCRTGGSGSDSLGVSWLLEHISLRIDIN